MDKKLYLSLTDRKLAGVCGGMGEFFGIDSTIIRIVWLISAFLGGAGVLAYLVCWAIMPNPSKMIR